MDSILSGEEKSALLKLARWSIARKLKPDATKPAYEATPGLDCSCGAFVSLHKKGSLRGCIGCFTAEGKLTRTVERMARSAAFEDPRFSSVAASELDDIDVEISVLSPMRRIDSVEEIEVGKHGLYVIRGGCRGVLLPQVATEYGWDRETFLEYTCRKACLPKDAWKDGKTEIYVFSAEVFGEKPPRDASCLCG